MTTTKRELLTAEDLLRLHSQGVKGELVLVDQHRRNDGEFLPAGYAFKSLPGHFGSPAAHQYKDFALLGVLAETVSSGGEHGEIAVSLSSILFAFVKPRSLGRVFAPDAGVLLARDPDVIREPDIGFISTDKLPLDMRVRGYYQVVPDLVVEIASPNDTVTALYDKARMWLSHGVTLVWAVYLDTRTIDVHLLDSPTSTLTEDDVVDGGGVLPGFTLPVRDVFD